MLQQIPPMSNAERQRLFRQRHPGYYQRLHARTRAQAKAGAALILAELAAAEQVAVQVAVEQVVPEQVAVPVARRELLMLPAPAEALVIPGVNAVPDRFTAALQLVELACRRAEAA